MSGMKGRAIIIQRNGVTVAGVRTKSITIGASTIDTTNDDDAAVRKLLDAAGQVDVSISVSGILVNDQLLSESLLAEGRVQTTAFKLPGGFSGSPDHSTLSGQFFMDSFGITGEHQGAATFEASFQSSGAVTLA